MADSEIRLDSAGAVDDVFVQCDSVHFERMDEHWFWLAVYRGGERSTFVFHADPGGRIRVEADENDLGLPVVGKKKGGGNG